MGNGSKPRLPDQDAIIVQRELIFLTFPWVTDEVGKAIHRDLEAHQNDKSYLLAFIAECKNVHFSLNEHVMPDKETTDKGRF